MLNKRNRISNRRLIQKLFDKGGLYKNTYFTFKFLPSTEPISQFAVVVSKKVAPKAVDRNELRRKIYEAIRLNMDSLKTDLVVLVIAKSAAEKKANYQELGKGIIDFFNRHELHE
ncbi:ribonuclease P protein component [Patescibacteria group bacterium]|nr:ribonuclease P protein component [Patescibacteria group bacterium]MBU1682822.1 ribonuclease P protein component [Patescibacteria group bacterium]MBU1934776.1 ribonuclease P protein component [Patescibacteria group bacterium]